MPFLSGTDHQDGEFLGECVHFIIAGFGTTYTAVFEDSEGAKNLTQNPACTSNSKHVDVRLPVLREIMFLGRYLVIQI